MKIACVGVLPITLTRLSETSHVFRAQALTAADRLQAAVSLEKPTVP